jgi:hypothetical protein
MKCFITCLWAVRTLRECHTSFRIATHKSARGRPDHPEITKEVPKKRALDPHFSLRSI